MIDAEELARASAWDQRRRLLPYRDALNDVAAYAALPEADRDVIVRWAETPRRVRAQYGIDYHPANFADPLLSAKRLRAHVLTGERPRPAAPTSPIRVATSSSWPPSA